MLSWVQDDAVEKIHFTTTALYTTLQPGKPTKKLFKCYLDDPQPKLPDDVPEGMTEMPEKGDYVAVLASSLMDLQTGRARYTYIADDSYILNMDYEKFEEVHTHTHV